MEQKTEEQPHAPVYAFQKARRCGAKTRSGEPCKSPCVRGRSRCRMHGGAKGSGAPVGNNNAYKHGMCAREAINDIRKYREKLQQLRQCIVEVQGAMK